MLFTLAALREAVAAAIRDINFRTFSVADVNEMVRGSMAEVGRIVPRQFEEWFTLTPTQTTVLPQVTPSGAQPNIEVVRVEVWETRADGNRLVALVLPASSAKMPTSASGWILWNGAVSLPQGALSLVRGREATRPVVVWGYAPFRALTADADSERLTEEQRQAVIAFARIEALERLNADRNLFTQWQTRAGNSDISPAGLMSMLSMARDDWRRRKRELLRLRSTV
jgi:hypothetical protein